MRLPFLPLALAALGCGRAPEVPDAGMDLASPGDLAAVEAAVPLFADVTFTGCPKVSQDGTRVRCTGTAPLALGLVAITPAGPLPPARPLVDSWLWTLPGADPPSSKEATPLARWRMPGRYTVTLVVGGAAGTAMAEAEVVVEAAAVGAACEEDVQCVSLACLCEARSDGGAPCAGALAGGLCTRLCSDGACGAGEVCVDFSRSAAKDAQVGALPWRHPICLAPCVADADCRAGFSCRTLPAIAPGTRAGGPFTWRRACFADLLGDVGAPCIDGDGKPAPSTCVTGECAALGARNACTLGCASLACPDGSACARFTGDPTRPICLRRCDAGHPCADPLLACARPDPDGALGFSVAGDPNATLCAPRRCKAPVDCLPAGSCAGPDGGTAFCQL